MEKETSERKLKFTQLDGRWSVNNLFISRLDRLTALDPAGPLFTPFSIDALNRNDFLFVDTIHTSAGIAGEFEIRLVSTHLASAKFTGNNSPTYDESEF